MTAVKKELTFTLGDNTLKITNTKTLPQSDNQAIVLPYFSWSDHRQSMLKSYPTLSEYLNEDLKQFIEQQPTKRCIIIYDTQQPKDKNQLRSLFKKISQTIVEVNVLIVPYFWYQQKYQDEVKMTFEEMVRIVSCQEKKLDVVWVLEDERVFDEAKSFYRLFVMKTQWEGAVE